MFELWLSLFILSQQSSYDDQIPAAAGDTYPPKD